ncbi:MAG: alkanesulfonate monooxygenase [Gammaproteobacteria bacterium]|nr:alkanesulfonate monooxygenase [Gammaproteobacteria bacterium]
MTFNVFGMIGVAATEGAAVHVIGGGIDPDYVVRFTEAHEQADFDAVLVGYTSASADGFQVAQFAASHTDRIRFLVAHRPGFVVPTLAARKAATFDNLTRGRLMLHIITGGSDFDQRRDGDFVGHDDRYARTSEYIEILKLAWVSKVPFDYQGQYYKVERAFSEVRCHQTPHVPIYFGGLSAPALEVGAKCADWYALFGESRSNISTMMTTINQRASEFDRQPRYQVSFRPIIAETESAAWDKAEALLTEVKGRSAGAPEAETAKRLLRLAEAGEIHDERLWTPIAAAAGGSGNTTALVGTPAQVADAILAYRELGVEGVLIRGFDPLNDATEYGRELIPRIREGVGEIPLAKPVKPT